ncbi:hypothetical protein ABTA99_19660, partial [Acinetobacter baumannii]
FRKDDWIRVVEVVAAESERLGCSVVAEWSASLKKVGNHTARDSLTASHTSRIEQELDLKIG